MIKKLLLSIIGLLFCLETIAQKNYFAGIDIGPKIELNRLATGGARPYSPNIENRNTLAAFFGVAGGVWVDEKWMFELGIYKSNHQAMFTILDEKGNRFFSNTLVNTYTSYLIPFSFNRNFTPNLDALTVYGGMGFSTFVGMKKGFDNTVFSESVPADPSSSGVINYSMKDNTITNGVIAINFQVGLLRPINEQVSINLLLLGRLGAGSDNYFDIYHNTPDHTRVKNTIYSNGGGVQLNFGFRYFFRLEKDE